MKANTTFIFAGIMSAIIGNAFAAGENTVTSKSYVDAQDALKQDKIPVSSLTAESGQKTQIAVPNTLVLSPTTIDGAISEIGVFDKDFYDNLLWVDDPTLYELFQNPDYINMIPSAWTVKEAIESAFGILLPTGAPGNVVTYDLSGGIGGSVATANAPTYTNGTLTNGSNIATIAAVDTRQAKMTCAGWPESVPVNQRTDENCWLWNKN
jgi:hypothetical protein